jgi:citrate lyase subunit beta/citryl-CoA lyase
LTTLSAHPRRSVLYMPASNAKAVEKARGLTCDAVILDLEDAVAPDAKESARAMAAAAVDAGGFGSKELIIRVNGLDTAWGAADIARAVEARPDAILVPKVNSASDVIQYQQQIGDADIDLWVMIETTRALFSLGDIAAAAMQTRLACFVMGANDLAKETGARLVPGREPMIGALGLAVAAAKSQRLCVLDGVYNDLDDDEGFALECVQGRNFGFDGKTLIHPRQIERCNTIFSPSDAEIAFAGAVVAAFAADENANRGVIRVEGKMAERLHLAQSERLLAIADAIGLR